MHPHLGILPIIDTHRQQPRGKYDKILTKLVQVKERIGFVKAAIVCVGWCVFVCVC